jgi:Ca2+-binding RTX toxin-like protein
MGGSTQASTVLGGEGSYTIFGGAGGGYFHGGSSGSNLLEAGNGGPTKLIAGGASDTLQGGNSIDSLIAAAGNETLISGSGTQILNLRIHLTSGTSGVGTTDTVQNFGSQDYFDYGGTHAINVALQSYQVSGGSGSFSLADGSTVVLQGYTGSISSNDFIKH